MNQGERGIHAPSQMVGLAGVLAALALVASACSNSSARRVAAASGGGELNCDTDPIGCITSRRAIRFASARCSLSRGTPRSSVTTARTASSRRRLSRRQSSTGRRARSWATTWTSRRRTTSAPRRAARRAGTKLANDPTILAVVGTTCSSSALGVADTILSNKGIMLISPSNTAADLTAEETHAPFYARTAQNDAIQAKVVSDFVYERAGLHEGRDDPRREPVRHGSRERVRRVLPGRRWHDHGGGGDHLDRQGLQVPADEHRADPPAADLPAELQPGMWVDRQAGGGHLGARRRRSSWVRTAAWTRRSPTSRVRRVTGSSCPGRSRARAPRTRPICTRSTRRPTRTATASPPRRSTRTRSTPST